MFSFFRKSSSIQDVGRGLGEVVTGWPARHREELRATCADTDAEAFEEVLNEVVYFLGFGTDYAIYTAFRESPLVMEGLRGEFGKYLGAYAIEHCCQPMMRGDWLDDSWIWMPNDPGPDQPGNPLENLNDRFAAYAAALKRRAGREVSAGESTAHLLAGLCMNLDINFLLFTSRVFSDHIIEVRKMLLSLNIAI